MESEEYPEEVQYPEIQRPNRLTFFENWFVVVRRFEPEWRLRWYEAIFDYVFSGVIPEFSHKAVDHEEVELAGMWELVKPNLDASLARYIGGKESGKTRRSKSK